MRLASALLGNGSARLLDARDRAALEALLAADPIGNVFVASRLAEVGLDRHRLGAEVWGVHERGRLVAACLVGANLVPVAAGPVALASFAERARRAGRRCSSVYGYADQVLPLWGLLEPAWGPAREVRSRQPLMVASRPSATVGLDRSTRRVRADELDAYLPACVAMYTEEVGVSPLGPDDRRSGGSGGSYRARLAGLIAAGRCFARFEDGQVVFKADVGAVSASVCQIQGVWTHPLRRGRGLATRGMAAVLAECLVDVAPVVSLYVNDYNAPALAAYRRVGFERVGTFATVLF